MRGKGGGSLGFMLRLVCCAGIIGEYSIFDRLMGWRTWSVNRALIRGFLCRICITCFRSIDLALFLWMQVHECGELGIIRELLGEVCGWRALDLGF